MHKLFTDEQFQKARSRDLLPLRCAHCEKTFYRTKHRVQDVYNSKKFDLLLFCSQLCNGKNHSKKNSIQYQCTHCGVLFTRVMSQAKLSKNHFCSQNCSGTYNNTHKTQGTRRSKLECWLEQELTILFPSLEINYNRTSAIDAELDIYVPPLKLAFELNGIFHYEPIYGPEKLASMQNNDSRKFQACIERGIELCVLDVSHEKYFKPKNSQKFLDIISSIINKKMNK